ncbi:MAG: hypothetical protein ACRCTU_18525 [Zoogloea sp.]|uniref:hypothetical protein n=1 Tax=Zoogloea sp. TaxID=49181 RepID=UPI003F317593
MSRIPRRGLGLLGLLFLATGVAAQDPLLIGAYAPLHSTRPDQAEWVVQSTGIDLSIVLPRTGETIPGAHRWTARERAVFWQSMLWPIEVSKEVVCVGGVAKVICRIGPEQRQKVPPLQELGSDYFYADDFGSIWPLKKLPDSR